MRVTHVFPAYAHQVLSSGANTVRDTLKFRFQEIYENADVTKCERIYKGNCRYTPVKIVRGVTFWMSQSVNQCDNRS